MLAHSPPFPIIIDHILVNDDHMTTNDVEGIILALGHRDRVRRIRFRTPGPADITRKLIAPIDGEFPMLEYMCIAPMQVMNFPFPKTFHAPQLRHLILVNLTLPIGSPLFSTTTSLVVLSLVNIPPPTYFQPHELLHRVSLIPHLEVLWIEFSFMYSLHNVNLDVTHMLNATHISLPNLRVFRFRGFNGYSEVLLSRITAPHLEVVYIALWDDDGETFLAPCLLRFMSTSEDLRLGSAILSFNAGGAQLLVYPNETAKLPVFDMHVMGSPGHKVSNAAQILKTLCPLFSSVMDLALDYKDNRGYPELQDEEEPTDWRVLLRSFNNVETLLAGEGVIGKLSRSLQLDDGESPDGLLPELKKLEWSPTNNNADAFTGFIDARQNAGRPVTLVDLKNTF